MLYSNQRLTTELQEIERKRKEGYQCEIAIPALDRDTFELSEGIRSFLESREKFRRSTVGLSIGTY